MSNPSLHRFGLRRWFAFAAYAILATPALAAGTFYGRWALNPAACSQDAVTGPLVVSAQSLQWPDTACRVRTSYRVGDTWHIGARCPDAASDVPVGLQLKGDRLLVEWGGGRAEFRRCP
jgi:hypothetical protein